MSFFLTMVEFGRPGPPPAARLPIRLLPVSIRPRGPKSAARKGHLVTDGVCSGRLRATGMGSVAREGEAMRGALLDLLRARLGLGLQVALVFTFEHGRLGEVVCDVEEAPTVSLDALGAELGRMAPGEPRWVVA